VHLDHEEKAADLDFKVTEAIQEMLGCQVSQDRKVKPAPLELDCQAQLVLKESVGFQELQDYQESQEDQDRMALLDNLVHLDRKVNQDEGCQAQKVCRDSQELRASRERRVALDYLVFLDRKARLGHQDLRESKVKWDPQDLPAWLDYQVFQEKAHLALLDHKEYLESKDHMVGKV